MYCLWCEEEKARPTFWPTCSSYCARYYAEAKRNGLR